MSEDTIPTVEEIKEQAEIPVEEEIEDLKQAEQEQPDVVEELKALGRQFGETLQTAWESEERVRVEKEVRAGVKSFVEEIDKVISDAKENPATEKVKGEAINLKGRVEESDITDKVRGTFVQGLHWLSEEFGKLAEQFTAVEKSPNDIDDGSAEADES